jgi:hypothetical protein
MKRPMAFLAAFLLRAAVAVAQPTLASDQAWLYGAFVDVGYLGDPNDPPSHVFRNRGTTPRVNDVTVNIAAAWLKKSVSDSSRWGIELTAHAGADSKTFGFSSTAPNVRGSGILSHLGPTDVQYLAPIGKGLTMQAGIFSSLIGYDALYAKDNLSYTRPWGADYTPYLMLGVNASYPLTPRIVGTFAVINGYFHLAHANNVPSLAAQVAYRLNDAVTVKQTVLAGPHQADTAFAFWRILSDTILERRTRRLVTAFEYQIGAERVDEVDGLRALWTSAQLPVHWVVHAPWSVTFRPELAWDRDGRWIAGEIGLGQSIAALTSTLEYRLPYRRTNTLVRVEHRVDRSRGPGGGFYDRRTGVTPHQQLMILAVVVAFDGAAQR